MARSTTSRRDAASAQLAMAVVSPASTASAALGHPAGSKGRRTLTPQYGAVSVEAAAASAPPAPPQPTAATSAPEHYAAAPVAFGAWLLQQKGNDGLLGQLAAAAAGDRGFPKLGSPEQVRARMGQTGADGEMWDALDDAELDWRAL